MPLASVVPSSKVIRCLFGPVDHEQRRKELDRLSTQLDRISIEKWNFDFALEKPLKGNYIWEKVPFENLDETTENSSSDIGETSTCPAENNLVKKKVSECTRNSCTNRAITVPVRQSRKRPRETEEQLTQRLITDYYKSVKQDRKRRKFEF